MKLAFIEFAGFRGFRDKTRFDLPGGFAVLTGRNGVGKSTVLDAFDYALTGTINKYPVTSAKGGGLEDHIWWLGDNEPDQHYVSIGLINESGEQFVIRRSRTGGLDKSPVEIRQRICLEESPAENWIETFMRTTLIRDESIASFSLDLPEQARAAAVRAAIGHLFGPDHTKRTGALLEATTEAKAAHDTKVEQVQADLGRALNDLTQARSVAERQPDVSEAQSIIRVIAPDIADVQGERADLLRRRIADRKQSISALNEAIATAENIQPEYNRVNSKAGETEISLAQSAVSAARHAKEHADRGFAEAQRIQAIERENDTFASQMAAILDHGESIGLQAGHCPLCDAVRSSEEFAAAITAARSNLSIRGERASRAATALDQARQVVQDAERAQIATEQHLKDLETKRTNLLRQTESVASIYARWSLSAQPSEPEVARRLVLQRQEETARLEHALFILEASSAHDLAMTLEARVEQLRGQLDLETSKAMFAEQAVETARQINKAAREVANQVVTEQFETVMPLLKELYQRLRPHAEWREIEIDFGGRVRASLNFTVGDGKNPQFLFSSGQRRAAGIAFLLAMHLSRPWCGLNSLLLDDPVQHIDDYRALNLVEVLSAVRRTGHQVIIAVEDPALADVLCRRLRSTDGEMGCRFELSTNKDGWAAIERQLNIHPMPHQVIQADA